MVLHSSWWFFVEPHTPLKNHVGTFISACALTASDGENMCREARQIYKSNPKCLESFWKKCARSPTTAKTHFYMFKKNIKQNLPNDIHENKETIQNVERTQKPTRSFPKENVHFLPLNVFLWARETEPEHEKTSRTETYPLIIHQTKPVGVVGSFLLGNRCSPKGNFTIKENKSAQNKETQMKTWSQAPPPGFWLLRNKE